MADTTQSIQTPSVWVKEGNCFTYRPIGEDYQTLPIGVYEIISTMSGPKLNPIADSFSLPKKTYPLNQSFINKVLTSWQHLPHNVGVLLAGRKGTGKSVIARQIANLTNCPVIIVSKKVNGFESYIQNRPQQDLVLLIDEVEKHWGLDDEDNANDLVQLLSLLDGTQRGTRRILTLLTANKTYNMDYLLDRPGRIRYYKNFDQIDQEDTTLIIEDLLVETQFKEDLLSLCEKVNGLTVDSLIALITEINLHKQPASVLIEDLNLTLISNSYLVTFARKTDEGLGEKIVMEASSLSNSTFSDYDLQDWWKANKKGYGYISEVIAPNMFVLEVKPNRLDDDELCILKQLKIEDTKEDNITSYFLVKVEPAFIKNNAHATYKNFMNAV